MLSSFEPIAAKVGVPLPGALAELLRTGRTEYGPDWKSMWRDRMLNRPPPLISCYDFSWLDAEASKQEIADWLNPEFQGGRRFLPFGRNGAGDTICLTPLDDGTTGVAHIFHDSDENEIGSRSFVEFLCQRFLETFADMTHLTRSFSDQEAFEIVKADVLHVTEFMDPKTKDYLRSFCERSPIYREFRAAPRAHSRRALSLISKDQLSAELLQFPAPRDSFIAIVSRWEVPSYVQPSPAPKPDWRVQALNPGTKFAAIKTYQMEFGVSMSVAKKMIDEFLQAPQREA